MKEIINISIEISEMEKRKKPIEKINDTESWFFRKIKKVDNILLRWTKSKRKTQFIKIKNEKCHIPL